MKKRHPLSYVGIAIVAAIAAVAWMFLAPPQIGGSTAYVVITGDSMEPLLHADDLAIVRATQDYEVGDVVAYESEKIDQLVLHRIVEEDGGRFVLQGDNNDFLDPEKPAEQDVAGELWGRVPRIGAAFRVLRSPIGLAVGGVFILFALGLLTTKKRRRRARHSMKARVPVAAAPRSVAGSSPPPPPPPRAPLVEVAAASTPPRNGSSRRIAQAMATAAGAGTLVCVILLALVATRPATIATTEDVSFEHAGTFDYSASTSGSAAYDGARVRTGEPVFVRVVDDLTLNFRYRFLSDATADIDSTGSLEVRLSADNGLRRTVTLPDSAAEGDEELALSATLDLNEIKELIRAIHRETGVEQTAYELTIAANVETTGTVGTEEIGDVFAPEVDLIFDGLQVRTKPLEEGKEDPAFTPTQAGSVTVAAERPNPITVFNREVSRSTAEKIAYIGGSASLLVFLAMALWLMASRPKNEHDRIEAKYGSALIPVSEVPMHADAVDVADFDTVLRLAEQLEQPILHNDSHGVHAYMVPHEGILYRYRPATPSAVRKPIGRPIKGDNSSRRPTQGPAAKRVGAGRQP